MVWDLSPGSYDRFLEHRARERAADDPPLLTTQRWAELLAAVSGGEEVERRCAQDELARAAMAHEQLLEDSELGQDAQDRELAYRTPAMAS